MSESNSQPNEGTSRRTFLKTTSALMGGAVVGVNATIARSAHVNGNDEIKVALIGCGGRGGGAVANAHTTTEGPVKLHEMDDIFEDKL